jgi:two-component system CheB/CheR fusion protein
MVVFARHNILSDPPFTKIDFISCRNLFIYLQPDVQRRVLQSFNFSLNPGGLLMLGNSESLGDAETLFETLDNKDKLFRTLGTRRPRSAGFPLNNPPDRQRDTNWSPGLVSDGSPFERKASEEVKVLESYLDTLSDKFIPFSMLVTDDNEIVRIIGNSRPFMLPLSGRMSSNLNQLMIKDLQIPITTGLARLHRTNSEVTFSRVRIKNADEIKLVNITIRPMRMSRNTARMAVIIIRDTENISETTLKDAYDADTELMHRLNDLEQELQFSRENLQATIEELETSNEELQATNEELLASNEELQSTNEELQSVNEELFTVNAEYQGKISQMSQLSDDIETFLSASKSAYVFLDNDMNLRRFSARASRIFNIIDHDIGRPISHLSHRLGDFDVLIMAREAHNKNQAMKQIVQTDDGDEYSLEIIPTPAKGASPADTMILMTKIQ